VPINMRKAMLPWWAVHGSSVANTSHASSVLGHMAHSAAWRYLGRPGKKP